MALHTIWGCLLPPLQELKTVEGSASPYFHTQHLALPHQIRGISPIRMGALLGQELYLPHQIRGILKSGAVSPLWRGGPSRVCLPHTSGVTQDPGSFLILTLNHCRSLPPSSQPSQAGGGRRKTPPSTSHITLGWGPVGPSQDPEIRKACLLFFVGKQASRGIP